MSEPVQRCQYAVCSERKQHDGKAAPAVSRLGRYVYCATDYDVVRRIEAEEAGGSAGGRAPAHRPGLDEMPSRDQQTAVVPRPTPPPRPPAPPSTPIRTAHPANLAARTAAVAAQTAENTPTDAELTAVLADVHGMIRRGQADGMSTPTKAMAQRLGRDLAKLAVLVIEGERQIVARVEVARLEKELEAARARAGLNHAGKPRERRPYDAKAAAKRAEALARGRATAAANKAAARERAAREQATG